MDKNHFTFGRQGHGIKLSLDFYLRDDVVQIARDLLGKFIFTQTDGLISGGRIVETEAYRGPEDKGSHAYNGKRTPRNEIMYAQGGVVYMYVCYGIHDMLNIVTGFRDSSHAILIRALEPLKGVELMRQRRNIYSDDERLCKGPGALTKALGLNKLHNGLSLLGDEIWIEDWGELIGAHDMVATPRIGLNIEEPYKSIPWRFYIRGNRFVSKYQKKVYR